MNSCPYRIDDIIDVMHRRDYVYFESNKGFDLNLIWVRTSDNNANEFNDWATVSYIDGKHLNYFAFPATTDPGIYYRENPLNVDGTAILPPGQYRSMWKIGKHRGKYTALVQCKPITVWRDNNKDAYLEKGVEDNGMFGINMHRSGATRTSTQVGKWSAGCQVIANPIHFDFLMKLCSAAAKIWGTKFSYTLLESKDFG